VHQTGVALVAVGVEDPETGSPAWRTEPVASDDDLGLLSDDVTPEADPAGPGELEAKPRGLRDRRSERGRGTGCLEQDEQRRGPPGERGQPLEPIRDLGRSRAGLEPLGQIDDQQVDRPTTEQRARDRQALIQV
jgi:hypothetical protein